MYKDGKHIKERDEIYQVVKRDGRLVDFDFSRIASTIQKAFDATKMPYDKVIIRMLTGYCAGWSLRQLIEEGLGSVTGKISSALVKHLNTLCNQMVNFLGIMQNEWAGAQAF